MHHVGIISGFFSLFLLCVDRKKRFIMFILSQHIIPSGRDLSARGQECDCMGTGLLHDSMTPADDGLEAVQRFRVASCRVASHSTHSVQ